MRSFVLPPCFFSWSEKVMGEWGEPMFRYSHARTLTSSRFNRLAVRISNSRTSSILFFFSFFSYKIVRRSADHVNIDLIFVLLFCIFRLKFWKAKTLRVVARWKVLLFYLNYVSIIRAHWLYYNWKCFNFIISFMSDWEHAPWVLFSFEFLFFYSRYFLFPRSNFIQPLLFSFYLNSPCFAFTSSFPRLASPIESKTLFDLERIGRVNQQSSRSVRSSAFNVLF